MFAQFSAILFQSESPLTRVKIELVPKGLCLLQPEADRHSGIDEEWRGNRNEARDSVWCQNCSSMARARTPVVTDYIKPVDSEGVGQVKNILAERGQLPVSGRRLMDPRRTKSAEIRPDYSPSAVHEMCHDRVE